MVLKLANLRLYGVTLGFVRHGSSNPLERKAPSHHPTPLTNPPST